MRVVVGWCCCCVMLLMDGVVVRVVVGCYCRCVMFLDGVCFSSVMLLGVDVVVV